MNAQRRNRWIWAGCIAIALALWAFVARVRMHLVDEPLFLGVVALAAAALTALYWWDVAADDRNQQADPNKHADPNKQADPNDTREDR